uniref:G_PROTEIN_RECEP_F1_2 domain-containing protein n=1 Tax=Caenorhabditis tropicalis TaxID=1561998 RepID=A0A1I7UKB9_9PELO
MVNLELVPLGVILFFVALIGIIGNTIMVVVFFKFKKLRSQCHFLIMMTCLADCFHNYGQLIFTVHLFGDLKTSQFVCFLMNIPTLIGVISGSCWMLIMGIDRFIACKWPISYRTITGRVSLYTVSQGLIPLSYTFVFLFMTFIEVDKTPVTCAVPLAMGSKTFVIWSFSNIILNGITMMLYSIVNCFVHKQEHGKTFKTVFKSIFITVTLVIVGWFITCISNTLIVQFIPTSYGKQLLNMYAGIPVNIACSSNIFVFYKINLDYRSCIKKLLFCERAKVGVTYVENEATKPSITAPLPSPEENL